jgi:hypothetical protein
MFGGFPDMYPFASNTMYGMTICAPLIDYKTAFKGAVCVDLFPTVNYGDVSEVNFDNYL